MLTYEKKLIQNIEDSNYVRFTVDEILDATFDLAFEEKENSSVIKIETYQTLIKSTHP